MTIKVPKVGTVTKQPRVDQRNQQKKSRFLPNPPTPPDFQVSCALLFRKLVLYEKCIKPIGFVSRY